VGIDLSGKAVAAARERFPHAEFYEADAISWFPDRTFDVIVAHEVLEHFENHQDFLTVVKRLLTKKGTLILTTPNARTLSAMEKEARPQDQPVENPLTASELKALLAGDFETKLFTTVIGGAGSSGLWNRLLQNRLTRRVADSIGGPGTGERLVCRAGYGLHLVWMGQRR
jgi:ubiquinone/menaquinone biosynthesis C-methylase UbiE